MEKSYKVIITDVALVNLEDIPAKFIEKCAEPFDRLRVAPAEVLVLRAAEAWLFCRGPSL